MKNACGLISFYIKAQKIQEIEKFCNSLQYFRMAVSWGGHESLVIPKCASIPQHEFDPLNPTHRLVRIYVGLEDAAFLVKDLEQAFRAIELL
jgi:cystathionine beta-lyase/cystathionine gamma-synthase